MTTPAAQRPWWGDLTDRVRARLNFQRNTTPEPNTGCLLWTGGVDKDGYGKFAVSIGCRKQIHLRAHRFAWEDVHGPLPEGVLLLHSCDTPGCVEERHAHPGNQKENIAEAFTRRRKVTGEQHPWARHPDAVIAEIRRLRASGVDRKTVAARFGMRPSNVWAIEHGKQRRWQ